MCCASCTTAWICSDIWMLDAVRRVPCRGLRIHNLQKRANGYKRNCGETLGEAINSPPSVWTLCGRALNVGCVAAHGFFE